MAPGRMLDFIQRHDRAPTRYRFFDQTHLSIGFRDLNAHLQLIPFAHGFAGKRTAESERIPAVVQKVSHGTTYRDVRSEEHTSELQSRGHLVCRLLLEKKNDKTKTTAQQQ